MRPFAILTLAALLCAASLRAAAEPLVIIVHPESGILRMTKEEAVNIFMGNQKHLRPGLVALPVEPKPEASRSRFYRILVNLPLAQVRTYWARLYFASEAQPPRQAQDDREVLDIVAANKGAVGFVEQGALNGRVRAVLVLEDPAGR